MLPVNLVTLASEEKDLINLHPNAIEVFLLVPGDMVSTTKRRGSITFKLWAMRGST